MFSSNQLQGQIADLAALTVDPQVLYIAGASAGHLSTAGITLHGATRGWGLGSNGTKNQRKPYHRRRAFFPGIRLDKTIAHLDLLANLGQQIMYRFIQCLIVPH